MEEKTQNSFPKFLVQTLKKSKTKKSKNSIIVHQICCHAFLEEQSWCSMDSSSFLFQHVYPIRLLEAAELLEADQRKHEGGHSKAQGEAHAKLYMQTWSQTPDQPPLAAH